MNDLQPVDLFQTSTERRMYKPVNVIDLTASQLIDNPATNTAVEELEDVLERRLTTPEIEVDSTGENMCTLTIAVPSISGDLTGDPRSRESIETKDFRLMSTN